MRWALKMLTISSVVVFPLLANSYAVKGVKGTVEVRRGVAEEWKTVHVGDVLRPEDTMRTGKKSSASLAVDGKQLTVPEQTMVDISDFRQMTQEEFLLKLAMENILAVPPRDNGKMTIPRTTVLHGAEVGKESAGSETKVDAGVMQLQGAKLLYDNAYYATSVLKTKETYRLFPGLQLNVDSRLRMASAFEKMKLMNEALAEYSGVMKDQLPVQQQVAVKSAIERIRKTQNRP